MNIRFTIVAGCLVAGLTAVSGRAEAQVTQAPAGPDDRAAQRLYGADRRTPNNSLIFVAAASGGYQTHLQARTGVDGSTPGASNLPQSGIFGGTTGLDFALLGRHLSFSGTTRAQASYYSALTTEPTVVSLSESTALGWQLARHTQVTASEGFSRQPYYSLPFGVSAADPILEGQAPADGVVNPVAPSAPTTPAIDVREHWGGTFAGAIRQEAGRHFSLFASYGLEESRSAAGPLDADNLDFTSRGWSAGIRYALSKSMGLRLGYQERVVHFQAAGVPDVKSQGIDGGVDFNKAISLTRRTLLTFRGGFASLSGQVVAGAPETRTSYSAVGQVSLTHEIGRSGYVAATGGRQLDYIPVFRQPGFYDFLSFVTGGMFNRRVGFNLVAAATRGHAGIGPIAGRLFHTYYAGSQLSVGLSRSTTFGVSYSYTRYDLAPGLDLSAFLSGHRDSQMVQVSVSYVTQIWASRSRRARGER